MLSVCFLNVNRKWNQTNLCLWSTTFAKLFIEMTLETLKNIFSVIERRSTSSMSRTDTSTLPSSLMVSQGLHQLIQEAKWKKDDQTQIHISLVPHQQDGHPKEDLYRVWLCQYPHSNGPVLKLGIVQPMLHGLTINIVACGQASRVFETFDNVVTWARMLLKVRKTMVIKKGKVTGQFSLYQHSLLAKSSRSMSFQWEMALRGR